MKPRESRKDQEPPPCPECGSELAIPIVHGIPTPAQRRALEQGKAVIADREEWEGLAEWHCNVCGCDWSGKWRRFKKPRA